MAHQVCSRRAAGESVRVRGAMRSRMNVLMSERVGVVCILGWLSGLLSTGPGHGWHDLSGVRAGR
eukprot:98634-Chlamydomonas_euryale.AAC.4